MAEPVVPRSTGEKVAFWVTAALGSAVIAFGAHGLWVEERSGAPSAARWFLGGALAMDLVIVPLAAILGWVVKRTLPAWAWPTVRAALVVSAVLVAFALPLIVEPDGHPANFTSRPRDYGSGLAAFLVATWAVAAVALLVRRFVTGSRGLEPS